MSSAGTPETGGTGTSGAPAAIEARGAAGIGLASLVAAISGFAIIWIATRTLSTEQNADFLSFWGLLFFLFGTLGGLQNETTRSVHVALSRPAGAARGPRAAVVGVLVGVAGAGALLVTAPWWAPATLGPDPWLLAGVVALAVVAFAGHSTVAGSLAGSGRWTFYARLVGAEAVVRLVLVGLAALAGARTLGLECAAAAAAATWLLVLLAQRPARVALSLRTDEPSRQFAGQAGQAMLAAAASSMIVVGFPTLLRLTVSPEVYRGAAPLVLAVTLTRAPLMMPLLAFQGVAITYFLTHLSSGMRPLLRLATAVLGVGVAGGALAALAGPQLMVLFGGSDSYRVEPAPLAALTLAAALLALLTLTGTAVLSLGDHRGYALGWVAATVVTVAALIVPVPVSLETRVAASLAVGPVVGVAVHVLAIRRAVRQSG